MNRPQLDENLSALEFKEYYWLKEELVRFCREKGINSSGGKQGISDRIVKFLETGELITQPKQSRLQTTSRFDWKHETLSRQTTITDNYKNTENVRAFFQREIGQQFKFNTQFMTWMKQNVGKTLNDASHEWERIAERKKSGTELTKIAPQFEYNQYTRDFHENNPSLSQKDAIYCWKSKKSRPGSNKYEETDLLFLENIKQ